MIAAFRLPWLIPECNDSGSEITGHQMASAPTLLKKDTTVAKETYFVSIDLGQQANAKAMTGIFVPDNYKISDKVDIILWLMGHHDNAAYPPTMAIDDYWVKYPHFKFREFVNQSKKNVVLVAPSLGPGSQAGSLTPRGGLASFIDQVLAALNAYGGFATLPTLNKMVIACHSGGGRPMLDIATTTQQYSDNIQQFWGFDCLYNKGSEGRWVQWAQGNAQKQLLIRYGNGGTDQRSLTLKKLAAKLSNVDVDGTTSTQHNDVPKTYQKATFFSNTQSSAPSSAPSNNTP
jgi:hypothetical protein